MVHEVIFGIEATGRGLRFAPYITKALRNGLFRGASSLVLDGYPYRGRKLTITVRLPPRGGDGGAYRVGAVRVAGRVLTGDVQDLVVPDSQLASPIEIELVDRPEPTSTMRVAEPVDGPEMPGLDVEPQARGAKLTFTGTGKRNVYRDGVRVASAIDAREWTDPDIDLRTRSACWSAETVDQRTNEVSHRSPAKCLFGARGERMQVFPLTGTDPFEIEVRAQYTGEHLVQLVATNRDGPVNTGVTCAVKRVVVENLRDGAIVGDAHVYVPHATEQLPSSYVRAQLVAGERYRIRIGNAATALNMSALEHFAHYTGGAGGVGGQLNRITAATLRLIAR